MPPVTADDNASPVIAYLITIPIAILFAGTAVAIGCSERWNKSDNRFKQFLKRRKAIGKAPLSPKVKTEDLTKSEPHIAVADITPSWSKHCQMDQTLMMMDDHHDSEATPKPLQLVKNADIADRTPYIPRRKSSVGKRQSSSHQDLSATLSQEQPRLALHVWPKYHTLVNKSYMPDEQRALSRASMSRSVLPNDIYNVSHQGVLCHDHSSTSSSECRPHRRLFSRILSSFTQNNDSVHTMSNLAKIMGSGQSQMPRPSRSTVRGSPSRTISMTSTRSTETSAAISLSRSYTINKPNSPNPLRAPPPCSLEEQQSDRRNGQCLPNNPPLVSSPAVPGEIPPPALATATLQSVSDIMEADVEKAATIWVAVDVGCGIHYEEDSSSSLRSKALGPPHTDPGFLANLRLHLTPASGCSILRLVGSDTRDFLLPGETWSNVAQILAEPPFRRKHTTKAFTLQSRPSSHALIDQLHTMLAPSGSSSQDLVHISVTFEHVLLPSNVQCCVSEKLSLERLSAWGLESRRQNLRRGQSPQKAARAPDHRRRRQQRDDVACKLLDVLELNLDGSPATGHRQASELLEDFFDGFEGSPRLEQRARDLLGRLEAKIRPPVVVAPAPAPASPTKRRRNAIDLPRGGAGQCNLQLQDITNQWSSNNRSARRRSPDVSSPAPLFSPRKRPSMKNLGCARLDDGRKQVADPTGPVDVGSPRFYEDEMDEASQIWKGMRDSSAGGGGGKLVANADEGEGSGEENGGCDVVGAPWL